MDLLSNLDSNHWQNAEPKDLSGLKDYTILKCKPLGNGKYEYAVQENVEDGVITSVTLEGGVAKNPLQSIRNVEFKVEDKKVVGINLDGDCVVKK